MAYIIVVNVCILTTSQYPRQLNILQAAILTDSGATCVCNDAQDPQCLRNEEYSHCLQEINRDFIIATAATAAFASFLMGLVANLPVALAPSMSMCSAYTAHLRCRLTSPLRSQRLSRLPDGRIPW
jgi:AGZA family xanthine/uracil permease-like MFS transporter